MAKQNQQHSVMSRRVLPVTAEAVADRARSTTPTRRANPSGSQSTTAGPVVLITPAQVAEQLGTPVRFVRRLIAERRIEFIKVGRYVRFDPTTVAQFVEAGRVPPTR